MKESESEYVIADVGLLKYTLEAIRAYHATKKSGDEPDVYLRHWIERNLARTISGQQVNLRSTHNLNEAQLRYQMERNCKAICLHCENGKPLVENPKDVEIGQVFHSFMGGERYSICPASPIRRQWERDRKSR